MERVGTLVHKLLEQYQQQAGMGNLLQTAQMLLTELKACEQENLMAAASSRVAVMMPAAATTNTVPPAAAIPPASPSYAEPEQPAVAAHHNGASTAPPDSFSLPQPLAPVATQAINTATAPKGRNGHSWFYDPLHDVPTLTHQSKQAYELNEAMGSTHRESLNERLRVEKIELGSLLQEAPVQDLKKAIGINDRYLFINELFRGDETMYERSIKTINGFTIYPEADFWIQRELKLKLGWNEDSHTVRHFDQLIKRRFS